MIKRMVEFITGREINWRRVWLIVLISFVLIYFGSCAYIGYIYS